MYLSTLGYSGNNLIGKYQQLFLKKLERIWIERISRDIPSSDFLLYPDIHGLLLASVRPSNFKQKDIYINELLQKVDFFKKNSDTFQVNKNQIIPGTGILLTLDYTNHDINNHNHPDHFKNNITTTFGIKSEEEWRTLFEKSFSIVKKVSPGFMMEIDRLIKKIIPYDVSVGVHNSASYSDVIGHLIMSYPVGIDLPEIALLEALLHEYNHNKLNLVMQSEVLVLNNTMENYYSPYRPDARHIHGIYLGLHALTGAYWVILNAQVQNIISLPDKWIEKAVLYVLKNGLSIQVLEKYGKFSPLGIQFFEEMKAVHKECLGFIRDGGISKEIISKARQNLVGHYHLVKYNHPGILS